MPRLTSPHPKTTKKSDEWVVVASYLGLEADMNADVALMTLQGSGIPAVRIPSNTIASLAAYGLTAAHPVRVLVPPDREAEARELLGDCQQ